MSYLLNIVPVMLGGAIGAFMRFSISVGVNAFTSRYYNDSKPHIVFTLLATAIANFLGCFALGFFFVLAEKSLLSNNAKHFLLVGLLGSLTTFSTLSLETFTLFKNGYHLLAILYSLLYVFVGIGFVFLGYISALSMKHIINL